MTKLAETYIRFGIRISDADSVTLQRYLEARANDYAQNLFGQTPDIEVFIKTGSVRVWIAVGGAICVGVSHYGSFRSGVQFLIEDAQLFSQRVFEDIENSGIPKSKIVRKERRKGVPGKISRVIQRIEKLEQNQERMDREDVADEIGKIRRVLRSIQDSIDDIEDRKLLLKSIPQRIRSGLPRTPSRPKYPLSPRVALRPDDIDSLTSVFILEDRVSTSRLLDSQPYEDEPYKIELDGKRLFFRSIFLPN